MQTALFADRLQILSALLHEDPLSESMRPIMATLRNRSCSELQSVWPSDEKGTAQHALQLMSDSLQTEEGERSVHEDYRRLFVGPQRLLVPPWGSVWMDGEYALWGKSTVKLRAWMRGHGIRLSCDNEPEDHVGYVLLLCAHMAAVDPEAMGDLLERYVRAWVPDYLEAVVESLPGSFYAGVAELTYVTLSGPLGLKPHSV